MKNEYDFSDAEQGKFYRPLAELDIPIYLDQENKEFFLRRVHDKGGILSISELINSILKKDIEISNELIR